MNQSSGEAPKFELPVVQSIQEADGQTKNVEAAPAPESSVGKAAPQTVASVSMQPPPLPAIPAVPVPASYQITSKPRDDSSSLSAAEADRIEKEWIDKAKAIVTRTQDDPREQNSEMGKVKADYIKRRFNKTIPTDDTVAV